MEACVSEKSGGEFETKLRGLIGILRFYGDLQAIRERLVKREERDCSPPDQLRENGCAIPHCNFLECCQSEEPCLLARTQFVSQCPRTNEPSWIVIAIGGQTFILNGCVVGIYTPQMEGIFVG